MFRLFIAIFVFLATSYADTVKTVNIGVLANKGREEALSKWSLSAEYLNSKIKGYRFEILPLPFESFPEYIQEKKIDFVLTNSAYYVSLENSHGISRIATLKTKDLNSNPLTKFGGVIIARADNDKIHDIKDLKGVKFGAVNKDSFGGWIMALRELKEAKIDENDLSAIFLNTHESVVKAVLHKNVDAGTVRTDTLEQMAAKGKIKSADFKIINEKKYQHFPYLVSTRLYPEWPIAKTADTDDKLAEAVAIALISMPSSDPAATSSDSLGWTIPLDYRDIHECLKELQKGPYKDIHKNVYEYLIKKYGFYFLLFVIGALLLATVTAYVVRLNAKLRDAKNSLEDINKTLQQKVDEKTAVLSSQYDNEKHLRSVLRTVADVNQLLITTKSADEMLDKITIALCSNEAIKSAAIATQKDGALSFESYCGIMKRELTDIEFEAFRGCKSVLTTDFTNMPEYRIKYIRDEGITAVYTLPLKSNSFTSQAFGVITLCTSQKNGFSEDDMKMIEELTGDIGFAINSFMQDEELKRLQNEKIQSYRDFIGMMVDMIEQRDTYTAGHTKRVAVYSSKIAEAMGIPKEEIKKLYEAAILHDIGKVVTPDSVLLKPSKLSALEYELIKEHVTAGYDVLSKVDYYKELAEIIVCHHEKCDGTGYPHGRAQDEIPILGHILALADSFDAMTTNRIYKTRKTVKEALVELKSLSGVWYHPSVVEKALEVLKDANPDVSIDQIGSTLLDKERLSYFFRDRLTKLFNEDYLLLTLEARTHHAPPKRLTIVSLRNFTSYNRAHTWEGGNSLLSEFADYLVEKTGTDLIFRLWGDKFGIADFKGNIEDILKSSPINGKEIGYEILSIDLPTHKSVKELRDEIALSLRNI